MVSTHNVPVLVVGAGPAGLIAALQLSRKNVKCMLLERNLDTTKWPKMDITNVRSMELLARLGIADKLREIGVPQNYSFDVLFSTGLGPGGEIVSKWDLPSPKEWRERIKNENDGSMPAQPYQRCSQALFEAWLKPRIQAEPLIGSHFGLKFESLEESENGVESHLLDVNTGERHIVRSQYVIGCDGAGSRVRKSIGANMIGGPVPMAMMLVHFKSRDLAILHKQGQFWHIFFSNGGVIISQDEVDTWTCHLPIALDSDWEAIDAKDAIYRVLGGSAGPVRIQIDEVMVKSAWRPNICVADAYVSQNGTGRVFLSGDSAHQNIPNGGYGMNTAVGDSFDIGWKIAAVLAGYGGRSLLDSYEAERRPVAIRNIERSGVHHKVHADYVSWVTEAGEDVVTAQNEKGRALRQRIAEHTLAHDGENKDHGIEFGYRNDYSPVVAHETPTNTRTSGPATWSPRKYIASTKPGVRAPHLYLADGKTSIFSLFGPDYTLVDFSKTGAWAAKFVEIAKLHGIPLKPLQLPNESHAAAVWEREAVLVRPDDFVAWRSPIDIDANLDVSTILNIATGKLSSLPEPLGLGANDDKKNHLLDQVGEKGFTGTVGNVNQDEVKLLAAFQK
ncbi:FAD binding domain-containing protein [Cadophora sp. MPI-SDFR-AT-0126]|nr:FAD binding domain-containing protein [Leotiomycetes sp. MPI-SDFR-AT-0126]